MEGVGAGERRLRQLLRQLRPARQPAPPEPPPAPSSEWARRIEARLRGLEARLARLERVIGGGVLVTVLVEIGLRLAERWAR